MPSGAWLPSPTGRCQVAQTNTDKPHVCGWVTYKARCLERACWCEGYKSLDFRAVSEKSETRGTVTPLCAHDFNSVFAPRSAQLDYMDDMLDQLESRLRWMTDADATNVTSEISRPMSHAVSTPGSPGDPSSSVFKLPHLAVPYQPAQLSRYSPTQDHTMPATSTGSNSFPSQPSALFRSFGFDADVTTRQSNSPTSPLQEITRRMSLSPNSSPEAMLKHFGDPSAAILRSIVMVQSRARGVKARFRMRCFHNLLTRRLHHYKGASFAAWKLDSRTRAQYLSRLKYRKFTEWREYTTLMAKFYVMMGRHVAALF